MFGTVEMGGKILNTGEGEEMMWVTIFTPCGVNYLFGVTFRLCQFD